MWATFYKLASPKQFFNYSRRSYPWLAAMSLLAMGYGVYGGLWLAPTDNAQGEVFRILYVHVPCAFLSLFIYMVMAVAAFVGLVWRIKLSFLVVRHSAPLGAIFTFLALLTGSLWGKPTWGTWWIWDARLTSELVLFFLYISIVLFQSAILHKQRGERALAILVLVGACDVPIIHFSVYWWNTLHQGASLSIFGPATIEFSMLCPLLAMIVAFILYYASLLALKIQYELSAQQARHHWLREPA